MKSPFLPNNMLGQGSTEKQLLKAVLKLAAEKYLSTALYGLYGSIPRNRKCP